MSKSIRIFIPLFILVILGHTGCRKKMFSSIVYEGVVYDTLGGVPVAGVKVELAACKSKEDGLSQCHAYTVGEATTDVTGHFKIEEKEARSNRYSIRAGNKILPLQFKLNKDDLKDSRYTAIYLKD